MTEPYRWTPPGLDQAGMESFLSVNAGIPVSARNSIAAWFTRDKSETDVIDWRFIRDFQTSLGEDLGTGHQDWVRVSNARTWFWNLDEQILVYLIDFVLSKVAAPKSGNSSFIHVEAMRAILDSAGSSWAVGERQGRCALVERVPSAVLNVVDSVLGSGGKANSLLKQAWENAFGIKPRASHAYYDAVKAIELLANPLISPKDGDATLGKDIAVLRSQASRWHFSLAGSKHHGSVESVVVCMQMLWHSQTDRHGLENYADVTDEEARAAVLLASTLIGWLSQGHLVKVAD